MASFSLKIVDGDNIRRFKLALPALGAVYVSDARKLAEDAYPLLNALLKAQYPQHFGGKASAAVKYEDAEGDRVLISSIDEFAEAVRALPNISAPLKLFISAEGAAPAQAPAPAAAAPKPAAEAKAPSPTPAPAPVSAATPAPSSACKVSVQTVGERDIDSEDEAMYGAVKTTAAPVAAPKPAPSAPVTPPAAVPVKPAPVPAPAPAPAKPSVEANTTATAPAAASPKPAEKPATPAPAPVAAAAKPAVEPKAAEFKGAEPPKASAEQKSAAEEEPTLREVKWKLFEIVRSEPAVRSALFALWPQALEAYRAGTPLSEAVPTLIAASDVLSAHPYISGVVVPHLPRLTARLEDKLKRKREKFAAFAQQIASGQLPAEWAGAAEGHGPCGGFGRILRHVLSGGGAGGGCGPFGGHCGGGRRFGAGPCGGAAACPAPSAAAPSADSKAQPTSRTPVTTADGQEIHYRISCDGCGSSPIVGNRWKCAVCPNFDLCDACEAAGKHPAAHGLLKIKLSEYGPRAAERAAAPAVHNDITCDGCGVSPIVGNRFKCTKCPDFDYCDKCEAKSAETHPADHLFLKIKVPRDHRAHGHGHGHPHPHHHRHGPFGHGHGHGPHAHAHGRGPFGPWARAVLGGGAGAGPCGRVGGGRCGEGIGRLIRHAMGAAAAAVAPKPAPNANANASAAAPAPAPASAPAPKPTAVADNSTATATAAPAPAPSAGPAPAPAAAPANPLAELLANAAPLVQNLLPALAPALAAGLKPSAAGAAPADDAASLASELAQVKAMGFDGLGDELLTTLLRAARREKGPRNTNVSWVIDQILSGDFSKYVGKQ